ncbi:hypothetical protein ACP70R_042502 [Stipagrostis hirtigluma subsp. patula]
MKDLSVLRLFSYGLFLAILLAPPAMSVGGSSSAMRADLTHVDSARGFTRRELLSRMAARSRVHKQRGRPPPHPRPGGHPATATVAPRDVGLYGTEYNIHFAIGTPRPQRVALTLDTGSELVWTQCKPCSVCFDSDIPAFNSSASQTCRGLPCSDPLCGPLCAQKMNRCFYIYSYADRSTTAGLLLRDTFVFEAPNGKGGTALAPCITFGCSQYSAGDYSENESGVAGFNRGRGSLPMQLNVGKFSYCFTSMFESNKTSPAFLGTPDDLRAHATGPIQSTPFVRSPADPDSYYLEFKGITVGSKRLPIDESVFAFKENGSGGTLIDSGTGITRFPQAVYEQLRRAFVEQVRLPVAEDPDSELFCFSLPQGKKGAEDMDLPKLVFHLAGADMDLPLKNYMVALGDHELCLVILPTAGSTIIGNFQQQNMHMVYDLESNKLFFAPAQCDKL